jgi:hypothetical protein
MKKYFIGDYRKIVTIEEKLGSKKDKFIVRLTFIII